MPELQRGARPALMRPLALAIAAAEIPVASLTSKAYAAQLRDEVDGERATPSDAAMADLAKLPREGDQTTNFSVVDASGNAVSNTYTLNFSFGVGVAAERTGVLLNNEHGDFSAEPAVPNPYGLVGGAANAVEPDNRPLCSMTPTIVLRDSRVVLVTGSPGGSRIITTVMQIILNSTVHGRDIATATAAPRVDHQWQPDDIRVEEGISPDTVRLLEAKGHVVKAEGAMGLTKSIAVGPDGSLQGASDPRTPGGAAVGD